LTSTNLTHQDDVDRYGVRAGGVGER